MIDYENLFHPELARDVAAKIVEHWLINQDNTNLFDFKEYEELAKSSQASVKGYLFDKGIQIDINGKLYSFYGDLVRFF